MFELDRHIEILLLKNSCVIVPGFGGFMAHHESARFDETDGMMVPPMRTVGFNPQLTLNDSLLVQSYIEAYDISYPEALRMIESEVAELRLRLERDRYFDVSSVGRLYLNDYGQYEFEPCSAGILTPSFYGLSGVEIQKLNANIVPIAETEPVAIAAVEDEEPLGPIYIEEEQKAETEETNIFETEFDTSKPSKEISLPWGKLAVACMLLLIAFTTPFALHSNIAHEISMSGFDMGFFNRFIPSELLAFENGATPSEQITKAEAPVDTKKIITIEPKAEETPVAEPVISEEIIPEQKTTEIEIPANEQKAEKTITEPKEKAVPEVKPAVLPEKKAKETETVVPKAEKKVEAPAKKNIEEAKTPAPEKKAPSMFTIVLSSSINTANADNYVKDLHSRGYIAARTYNNGKQVRVVHGRYASYIDACQMRENLQALPEFEDCWVLEIPQ